MGGLQLHLSHRFTSNYFPLQPEADITELSRDAAMTGAVSLVAE